MNLILIRHAHTQWNEQRRTQGRSDIALSDRGITEAKAVAKRLKKKEITAIYASPLLRAYDTAKIIAKEHEKSISVIPDERLVERNFGLWEGQPFHCLSNKYPGQISLWKENPHTFTPPDGEDMDEVIKRLISFLEMLKSSYDDEANLVIVSHSIPVRLLTAYLIGLPFSKIHSIWLDNVSYTQIKLKSNIAILRVFNDTSHLKGIEI